MLFQVISRNNDSSGNPFRLVIIYSENKGNIERVLEVRSSTPGVVTEMKEDPLKRYNGLLNFHLSPGDYNKLKKDLKASGIPIGKGY